jgi:hypothetical protein
MTGILEGKAPLQRFRRRRQRILRRILDQLDFNLREKLVKY